MLNEKSPDIYVGLFDIKSSEKQYTSFPEFPIGIAYCYPKSSAIDLAVAERGYHRQLHNLCMYGSVGKDTSPIGRHDEISAFGWQKEQSRKLVTCVICFIPEKPPYLEQKEYEDFTMTIEWAAQALATVLHEKLYKDLPDIGTMHQINFSDDLLKSNLDTAIYRYK
jgi:hypothetical protein